MREDSPAQGPVAGDKGTAATIWLILARPQRLAGFPSRIGGREPSLHQRIVDSNYGDIGSQLRLVANLIGNGPLSLALTGILVAAHDLGVQMFFLQPAMQFFDVRGVIDPFVPHPRVRDIQAIRLFRGADKVRNLLGHLDV